MKLPDKSDLRKAVMPLIEPSSEVLAYFQATRDINLVCVAKTLSVAKKRVYTLLFYERSAVLKYATFVNRSFEVLTLKIATPVRWYRTLEGPRAKRWDYTTGKWYEEPAKLINCGSFYSYFKSELKETKLERSPMKWLEDRIYSVKITKSEKKKVENRERKLKEFEARFQPIHKGFLRWAYNLYNRGLFDIKNRRSGHCTECGADFITDSDLKHGKPYVCPACGKTLTMCSLKKNTRYKEYPVQYLDREKDGTLVVRHFIMEKIYNEDQLESSGFLEYERDTFDKSIKDSGIFFYHTRTYDGYWRDSKPYMCSMFQMRHICYQNEPIYRGNLKKVFSFDGRFKYSAVNYLPKNYKCRLEDYLLKYLLKPSLVEQCVKSGYCFIVDGTSSDGINHEKSTSINELLRNISPEYLEFIKSNQNKKSISMMDIRELRALCNKGISLSTYIKLETIHNKSYRAFHYSYHFSFANSLVEKFKSAHISLHKGINYLMCNDYKIWSDYVDSAIKVYNALETKIRKNSLLPKNLHKEHDKMVEEERKLQKEIEKQRIANLEKVCKKVYQFLLENGLADFKKDGYAIVLPRSHADFIQEANNLSICVGKLSYLEEHAANKGIIFFVRKENDINHSYVCVEAKVLKGRLRISQCRGFGNDLNVESKSSPGSIVEPFANKFVDKLNKKLKFDENKYIMPTAA